MADAKRIAKNTILLYFRQILIMAVSLYTVRVVLNVLGAEDYGIYNVVAGVVTMFGFLGKKDFEHLKVTFSVTMQIYLLLSVIILLLAETIGLWFVNNKLVIPSERLTAANFIYQTAIISFLLTLLATPYMACIIAHENMNVYAYVSIVEASLKLIIVLILKRILNDKLIIYGILLAIVALINTSLYRIYCLVKYKECKLKIILDKELFKELFGYSGWNLFGASIGVVKNQIMNILLNIFFGPITNAARGIAAQVSNAVVSFGQNFSTAMRPQLIKSYANNDYENSLKFVYLGCKLTFFLMYILILPLAIEMDTVLTIWLKNPPAEAVLFTRLVLMDCLIDCISYQIMTLAQATGKIKLYQGVVGGTLLLNLPIAYIALKFGAPSYSVLLISIIITIVAAIVRLFIVRRLTVFSISTFLKKTIIPCLLVFIFSSILPLFLFYTMKSSYLRLFVIILSSVVSVLIFIFLVGLEKQEKKEFIVFLRGKLCKKH